MEKNSLVEENSQVGKKDFAVKEGCLVRENPLTEKYALVEWNSPLGEKDLV